MKLHICQFCTEQIAKDEEMVFKNGYAHRRCFNVSVKASQTAKNKNIAEKVAEKKKVPIKVKPELKEGLTEEQWQEKQSYYDYIRNITNCDVSAKTRVLSDNYINKYNFTYTGMQNSLKYFYIIKEHVITSDCVGIIPYIYEEAQAYIQQQNELIDKIKLACADGIIPANTKRTVYIKPKKEQKEFIPMETID